MCICHCFLVLSVGCTAFRLSQISKYSSIKDYFCSFSFVGLLCVRYLGYVLLLGQTLGSVGGFMLRAVVAFTG